MEKKLDTYHTFLDIHEEVVGKVNAIKKLEMEVHQIKHLIPEKENCINALREEVKELKERNEYLHETILTDTLDKKQYDEQTIQLTELIKLINQRIEQHQPLDDDFDLPDDIMTKVNLKIDQALKLVSSEYTQIRRDHIDKERKELHDECKAIENEMLKLSEFPRDWTPIEHFNDVVIGECELRYSPEDNAEFKSLSSISLPITDKSPSLMENSVTVFPDSHNDIEPLKQKVNSIIQSQNEQIDFVNSSYESQAAYFNTLRNELSSKTLTEVDLEKLNNHFQDQLIKMNELVPTTPIQIPDIQISNNEEQSIQILTEQFDNFVHQIEENHPRNSISETFIDSTQKSLNIPEFEEPPIMQCEKKSVLSSELLLLSDSLKDLIKSANRVESLQQIREHISSKRKLFEDDATKDNQNIKEKSITPFELPRPLSPPPENLTMIEFKELAKSKLPEMFFNVVDHPDFKLQVENLPEEDQTEQVNLNEDSSSPQETFDFYQNQSSENDAKISMNAEERERVFRNILQDFASFELPPVPHFNLPAPFEMRVKPVDLQPVKNRLDNILEVSEEDDSFLIDEINQLEAQAKELSAQLVKELFDVDHEKVTNSRFSIAEIENGIENLEIRKKSIEKEKEKSVNKAKEIRTQMKETYTVIDQLKKNLKQVTITPEMIKEKNEEIEQLNNSYHEKVKSMM